MTMILVYICFVITMSHLQEFSDNISHGYSLSIFMTDINTALGNERNRVVEMSNFKYRLNDFHGIEEFSWR